MSHVFSLTHFHCIMIVEWTTAVHEAPINAFRSILSKQISTISYSRNVLSILVNQNAAMKSHNSNSQYIPDTSLSFFSKVWPCLHKYQLILEVVFMQSLTNVLQKVKGIIELFPKITVVLVINISESCHILPESGNVVWANFRNYGSSIDFDTFLAAGDGSDASVGHPVTSGGHTWCFIEWINYHIWVKDGLSGPKINIDVMEGVHYACSSITGDVGMDWIEALLNQGFNLIRDSLIAFSQELSSSPGVSVDLSTLQNHNISFTSLWNFFLDEFKDAAELTGYEDTKHQI
ncbi:hypothetical protein V8E55_007210 [Tylopilus felleus]